MLIFLCAISLCVIGALAVFSGAIWMLNMAQHYDDIADLRKQVHTHMEYGEDNE